MKSDIQNLKQCNKVRRILYTATTIFTVISIAVYFMALIHHANPIQAQISIPISTTEVASDTQPLLFITNNSPFTWHDARISINDTYHTNIPTLSAGDSIPIHLTDLINYKQIPVSLYAIYTVSPDLKASSSPIPDPPPILPIQFIKVRTRRGRTLYNVKQDTYHRINAHGASSNFITEILNPGAP